MGGTPSSWCLKANKYPGLELGQPFTTHTIFVKKMALIFAKFLLQVSAGSQNIVKDS
jgi:hypothetical protein